MAAAKFLQIEGAKDFILPKNHGSGQGSAGQAMAANNRMQNNVRQQQQSLVAGLQQRHNQMSLLSKLVQKPPLMRPMTISAGHAQEQSGVSSSEQKEFGEEQRGVKHELDDDEGDDEEDEDIDEALDKNDDKSGMFNEFEGNGKNNESVRHSEDDSNANDDEPMETNMGHILSKVPIGTSVSTTVVGGDQQNNGIPSYITVEHIPVLPVESPSQYSLPKRQHLSSTRLIRTSRCLTT